MFVTKEKFEGRFNDLECNLGLCAESLNDKSDRTLLYGYELDRSSTHIYMKDGEIHYNNYNNDGGNHYIVKSIYSEHIPEKRTYPESTDSEFLDALSRFNIDVCFTTYDQDRADKLKGKNFHGEVY